VSTEEKEMTLNTMERERREIVQISAADKRYWPRWQVNKHVEYMDQGKEKSLSFTRDLSMDGASIVILGIPVVRESIVLRIHLGNKVNVETQARVVWNKIEQARTLLGIHFDRLSEKAQEQITYHAFELNNRPLFVPNAVSCRKTKAGEAVERAVVL
jgi:c-di-GMP-binding flagellar brake protein YcgR